MQRAKKRCGSVGLMLEWQNSIPAGQPEEDTMGYSSVTKGGPQEDVRVPLVSQWTKKKGRDVKLALDRERNYSDHLSWS